LIRTFFTPVIGGESRWRATILAQKSICFRFTDRADGQGFLAAPDPSEKKAIYEQSLCHRPPWGNDRKQRIALNANALQGS
jgi:hypothetical protein